MTGGFESRSTADAHYSPNQEITATSELSKKKNAFVLRRCSLRGALGAIQFGLRVQVNLSLNDIKCNKKTTTCKFFVGYSFFSEDENENFPRDSVVCYPAERNPFKPKEKMR